MTLMRHVRSKRATQRFGFTSPTLARSEDAFRDESVDPLAVAHGALEVISADESVLGYEDEAGGLHPLF